MLGTDGIIKVNNESLYKSYSLLPSSVKVILLIAGPYPAEVLALTETLYGMYLSMKMVQVYLVIHIIIEAINLTQVSN